MAGGFSTLRQEPRQLAAAIAALIALPTLVYAGNPAIALVCAVFIAVTFDRPGVPAAATVGKTCLQTAIILLGLSLNVTELWAISRDYSLAVTGYVLVTLAGGLGLGVLLGNTTNSSKLIASGTAICGGTTIASLSPVIGAKGEETGVALALVFLLNALALLVFPFIGEALLMTQEQFGVWCALAIHDTSSVVATAALYGEEAQRVATTLKLGRTLWLIPLLLVFSILQRAQSTQLRIPGFVFGFVIASVIGSLVPFPDFVLEVIRFTTKALLVIALFCIGSDISRTTLKNLRGAPLLHGTILWAIAAPGTLLMILLFTA